MATSSRRRKLNVKTLLGVLREDQIDPSEYESLTTESQIATGVEQGEENEYHLQAVLQGSVASTDKEIPVPPPQESQINYDDLYPVGALAPANYIRFSQTVEECIGCRYDMTEDDDVFLTAFNQKKPAAGQLSEDVFERILEVFQETASTSTPYAAVDKSVVPYDHMLPGLNHLETSLEAETAIAKVMPFAKEMYEYWREQRIAKDGALHPTVKFETHQETDEMDPYVCFRRREVRQTRKTRARDVQSADKLKRLRRELEDGRHLVMMSHERELLKRELLSSERLLFEHRARLKETKVRLGIKENDEDLINQKREKRKAPELNMIQRPPGTQLRLPVRPDGRSADADLVPLSTFLADKENEVQMEVLHKIEIHQKWNSNHLDLTRDPLQPAKGQSLPTGFIPATTYLITPPTSASSEGLSEPIPMELDTPDAVPSTRLYPGLPGAGLVTKAACFRLRMGRLGRTFVDRRGLLPSPWRKRKRSFSESFGEDSSDSDSGFAHKQTKQREDDDAARWKYDHDDSDVEPSEYEVDPYASRALKFRSSLTLQHRRQEAPANALAHPGSIGQGGRPSLPAPAAPRQAQNTGG